VENAVVGVCAIIRNEKGEVLLIKHKKRTPWHGYWILPGGKLENNESLEECVEREIREELGVVCRAKKLLNVFVSSVSARLGVPVVLIFYEVSVDSFDFKLKKDEIEDARWFSVEYVETSPTIHDDIKKVLREFSQIN